MNKRVDWLLEQLGEWQREGLLDAGQAERIAARYRSGERVDGAWGRVILAAFGAIIFGLGVILVLAYNWEGLHRYGKLALVFVALIMAHGAGLLLNRPQGRHRKLGESLQLLGTMLFGAGIWLVAQLYHIDEHYPNAFMAWSLGALALAWAIPSVAQGCLAVILVLLWSWFTTFDFDQPSHWALCLVAVGAVPLAWLQRSRALLAAALTAVLLVYAFGILHIHDDLILSTLLLCSGAYLALARLAPRSRFPLSTGILRGIGYAVYLAMLFVMSFIDSGVDLLDDGPEDLTGWIYVALPLLGSIVAWTAALLQTRRLEVDATERVEDAMVMLVIVLIALSLFGPDLGTVVWLASNLLLLGHGSLCLMRGMQQLRWKQLALGCAIIGAVVVARFFDLFDSLLLRSVVFLVLGAGLFAIGMQFSRQRESAQNDA